MIHSVIMLNNKLKHSFRGPGQPQYIRTYIHGRNRSMVHATVAGLHT